MKRGRELRVRGVLLQGRSGAVTPNAWQLGLLGAGLVQRRCGHRGVGGRKLKAVCGNKPETRGRKGRTVAAEGYKHLKQYLPSS